MAKKNQQAKKMAAAGKSASQIKAATGVGSQSAQRYVAKQAPTPAPAPAPPRPSAPSSGGGGGNTSSSGGGGNSQGIKSTIREAGNTISNKELNKVVKAAGSVEKALNKISSVQQSAKQADKPAPSINAGAANMLIKQAQSTPTGVYQLGSSKVAQAIQSMAGTPAGPMIQGQQKPGVPGSGLMTLGTVLKPGGGVANKPQPMPVSPYAGAMDGKGNDQGLPKAGDVEPTVTPNPNQEILDAIAVLQGENQTLRNDLAGQDTYFQDLMNQSQMTAQQQMADMSNMFNQQMMGAQDMYNMQIQQANAQALADQEAARAFMINQGRGVMPANLQIGATYGTPQLAGTQGFKRQNRRPILTPAQTATAFTAPTLAATAAANPMMTQQPTVLNV
jgi:hypothetical protein